MGHGRRRRRTRRPSPEVTGSTHSAGDSIASEPPTGSEGERAAKSLARSVHRPRRGASGRRAPAGSPGDGLGAGIRAGRWNPHEMVWTYLALAAGILVLLNVLVVVALAIASRPRHDDHELE